LSRVKSGGNAAYLLSVAEHIACREAGLLDAFFDLLQTARKGAKEIS
jgi:hypothetical protein